MEKKHNWKGWLAAAATLVFVVGGTLITRELPVSSSPNDAIMITGLTSGQSYFIRVAAVYPGPSRSEWAYLNGADGKPVAVIPGKGLVE